MRSGLELSMALVPKEALSLRLFRKSSRASAMASSVPSASSALAPGLSRKVKKVGVILKVASMAP